MTDPNEALLRAAVTTIADRCFGEALSMPEAVRTFPWPNGSADELYQIISDAIAYPELLAVVEAARRVVEVVDCMVIRLVDRGGQLEAERCPDVRRIDEFCAACRLREALAAYDAKREEQG